MTRRCTRFAFLLAASLVLAACGALTKLAYSNAALAYANLAPMATWMVDDYVDLSGGQKDWVKERLTRAMQWHRSHELPQYSRFLGHVLQESEEPFTAQEIDDAYADLRVAYHRMVEQLIPDVADFFLQLDASQLSQMEKKFSDDNRKFVKESVSGTPGERLDRRVHKFLGHLDNWLGSVSDAQRRLVHERYGAIPDHVEERLADRRFRQTEILALVRSRPAKEGMIAGLHRLLIDTETWRRPEFVKRMRERDLRMFEMLAALSTTLTPEQRRHLQGRIQRYMRDINTLTGSARETGG